MLSYEQSASFIMTESTSIMRGYQAIFPFCYWHSYLISTYKINHAAS